MDEPNSGCVAPDEHGASRHQVDFDALRPLHAVIDLCDILNLRFKLIKGYLRVAQSMRQIQNRTIARLSMDAVKMDDLGWFKTIKYHRTRLIDWGKLRGIPKHHNRGKYVLKILKLFVIQHGGFIKKRDIQRVFASFPARNEIRPAQTGSRQCTRN